MTGIEFWLIVGAATAVAGTYQIIKNNRARAVANYNKRHAFKSACIQVREKYNIVVKSDLFDPDNGCNVIHPVKWHDDNTLAVAYDKQSGMFVPHLLHIPGLRYHRTHADRVEDACNILNAGLTAKREAEVGK